MELAYFYNPIYVGDQKDPHLSTNIVIGEKPKENANSAGHLALLLKLKDPHQTAYTTRTKNYLQADRWVETRTDRETWPAFLYALVRYENRVTFLSFSPW